MASVRPPAAQVLASPVSEQTSWYNRAPAVADSAVRQRAVATFSISTRTGGPAMRRHAWCLSLSSQAAIRTATPSTGLEAAKHCPLGTFRYSWVFLSYVQAELGSFASASTGFPPDTANESVPPPSARYTGAPSATPERPDKATMHPKAPSATTDLSRHNSRSNRAPAKPLQSGAFRAARPPSAPGTDPPAPAEVLLAPRQRRPRRGAPAARSPSAVPRSRVRRTPRRTQPRHPRARAPFPPPAGP